MVQFNLSDLPDQPEAEKTETPSPLSGLPDQPTTTATSQLLGLPDQAPEAQTTVQPDRADVEKREVQFEQGKELNSIGNMLGLKPTQLKSGSPELKAAIAKNAPEAPTIGGALKEVGKTIVGGFTGAFGKESIFAGGTIGEFLGAKLATGAREKAVEDVNSNIEKIEAENPELAGQFKQLTIEQFEANDPTALQVAADVGLVALDVLTMGKGKAATTAIKLAGKQALKEGGKAGFKTFLSKTFGSIAGKELLKSTAIGAAFGGGQAVKEGADILSEETLTGAGIGAGVGATIVGAPLFLGAAGKKIVGLLPEAQLAKAKKEVVGLATRITQGKTKDATKASRALADIDATEVTGFKDLAGKMDERISTIREVQDEVLSEDTRLFRVGDLTKTTKVGNREVKQNFITESLDDLAVLYENTNELENLAKVQNLQDKLFTDGLSNLEINKLAREYGSEFKAKAFTKTGDAKTSVSAGRFENNRSGIKEKSREILGDDRARILDKKMSDLIKTKENVEKMVEAVNNLSKKSENRSLLQKAGGALADIVDVASGGVVGSFGRRLLVPRGGGLKTLNALDLEEELAKNLKAFSKSAKKSGLTKQAQEVDTILSATKQVQ